MPASETDEGEGGVGGWIGGVGGWIGGVGGVEGADETDVGESGGRGAAQCNDA